MWYDRIDTDTDEWMDRQNERDNYLADRADERYEERRLAEWE